MTEVFLQRRMSALRPIDEAGASALADIPQGEIVRVTIRRPRNLMHHRKFFALIKAIFPHQAHYPTEETLLAAIKVALGYGESVKLHDGRTIIIPSSISFAKMDQGAFDSFYDRALHLILTKILPGVDRKDLDREVADILAGYGSAASGERAGVADGLAGAPARDVNETASLKPPPSP